MDGAQPFGCHALRETVFYFISQGESTQSIEGLCDTGGHLLTRFFETLEKQPCKRRSDLVLNGQMRVPK